MLFATEFRTTFLRTNLCRISIFFLPQFYIICGGRLKEKLSHFIPREPNENKTVIIIINSAVIENYVRLDVIFSYFTFPK